MSDTGPGLHMTIREEYYLDLWKCMWEEALVFRLQSSTTADHHPMTHVKQVASIIQSCKAESDDRPSGISTRHSGIPISKPSTQRMGSEWRKLTCLSAGSGFVIVFWPEVLATLVLLSRGIWLTYLATCTQRKTSKVPIVSSLEC